MQKQPYFCSKPVQRNWGHFLKSSQKTVPVLRVNETKTPPRNALIALESQKRATSDERSLFWNSSRSLDLSLNPQPPNDAIWRFHRLLSFQPFFGNFLLFLEKKTKSIRFCTKFYAKAAIFLPCNCTSLLLCSKPVQQNWRHFLKSFRKQCAFYGLS